MSHTIHAATHGGAGSSSDHVDGPDAAVQEAMEHMVAGRGALGAACHAVVVLEDDPRFNAGTGSNLRLDGETIEMDAACMASDQRFGAVGAIQRVKNPVLVAREVLGTPHLVLVGEGATRFARAHGHASFDPTIEDARRRYQKVQAFLAGSGKASTTVPWTRDAIRASWNFPRRLLDVLGPSDTVGAVTYDGEHFAAALSSGGFPMSLMGRVGDVPLPGCGLHAGPVGAVAATGLGEAIARERTAQRAYALLEGGAAPQEVVDAVLTWFADAEDIGVLVVDGHGTAGGSNRDMAWAQGALER